MNLESLERPETQQGTSCIYSEYKSTYARHTYTHTHTHTTKQTDTTRQLVVHSIRAATYMYMYMYIRTEPVVLPPVVCFAHKASTAPHDPRLPE